MKIRRIDFYPTDFTDGVSGLTPIQIGVYWVVCSLIYSAGGPIPVEDQRLRLIKCDPRTIRKAIQELVKMGKIHLEDDGKMIVRRCEDELDRGRRRIEAATKNGAEGNKIKKMRNATAKSTQTLSYNKQQTTRVSAGIGRGNGLDAQPPNALKQYETGFTDEHNRVHVKLADGPILKIGPYGAVDVAYEPRDYERRLAFTSEQAVQMREQALANPKTLISSLEGN
jgi:uncharacterized protein YdaU (DUF1376 family)